MSTILSRQLAACRFAGIYFDQFEAMTDAAQAALIEAAQEADDRAWMRDRDNPVDHNDAGEAVSMRDLA